MGAFDHLSDDDPRVIEHERRQQRCSCENKAVRPVGALKRTDEIYRLLTLQELILKYPNAWFNEAGDLILTKNGRKWIVSSMLHHLGEWHPGFHSWMYVRR